MNTLTTQRAERLQNITLAKLYDSWANNLNTGIAVTEKLYRYAILFVGRERLDPELALRYGSGVQVLVYPFEDYKKVSSLLPIWKRTNVSSDRVQLPEPLHRFFVGTSQATEEEIALKKAEEKAKQEAEDKWHTYTTPAELLAYLMKCHALLPERDKVRAYSVYEWLTTTSNYIPYTVETLAEGDDSYAGNYIDTREYTAVIDGHTLVINTYPDWDNYQDDGHITFDGVVLGGWEN